jgi:hypothetical protein
LGIRKERLLLQDHSNYLVSKSKRYDFIVLFLESWGLNSCCRPISFGMVTQHRPTANSLTHPSNIIHDKWHGAYLKRYCGGFFSHASI